MNVTRMTSMIICVLGLAATAGHLYSPAVGAGDADSSPLPPQMLGAMNADAAAV